MVSGDNILKKIRIFDAYPKTLEDFRVKTYGGAAITIVSGILIVILFISELNYYLTPEVTDELLVDVSKGDQLRINVDLIFPKISCSFLSIDAIDVSGEQHINIVNNIYKRRLDTKGEPLEDPQKDESVSTDLVNDSNFKSDLGVGTGDAKKAKEQFIKAVNAVGKPTMSTLDPARCESCYGAESDAWKCCNTCDDVRAAYSEKGWALKDMDKIVQCKREGITSPTINFDNEGCQIFGYVEVSRVGGNFHIAPGRSHTKHHVHVHDLSLAEAFKVNITHKIRHLSFGKNIPGKTNPLDGTYAIADEGSMMFQYYVKIVPTIYTRSDGSTLQTNQFAVTRHKKQTQDLLSESGLPGVFFIYEFAPMMVKYSEKHKSFMHFLTSVCAIIGGVFTVAGIIDSIMYHSVRAIQKKIELGKAS